MNEEEKAFREQAYSRGIDWVIQFVPIHVVRRIVICQEREAGRTYGQIGNRHSITRQRAKQICEVCPEIFDEF